MSATTKAEIQGELRQLDQQLNAARYHAQEEVDPGDKKAVSQANKQVDSIMRSRTKLMDRLRKIGRREARRQS
ncbi:MAG TPA: hypothetical protein VFK03_01985 [Candidatus Saccharimonadales bacterium]|nr:hypothetical protein [Candidatus Saccharimonadales bacterium]